jgi:hypothetical protein
MNGAQHTKIVNLLPREEVVW